MDQLWKTGRSPSRSRRTGTKVYYHYLRLQCNLICSCRHHHPIYLPTNQPRLSCFLHYENKYPMAYHTLRRWSHWTPRRDVAETLRAIWLDRWSARPGTRRLDGARPGARGVSGRWSARPRELDAWTAHGLEREAWRGLELDA
uniref:Uncharacterized protein n=1 Tax=Zea mays TaxID=4577 RepID=B8A2P5_MAIZE|nr:unknown [Zea mays]